MVSSFSSLTRLAASTGAAAARAGDYEGRVTFKVVLACFTAATGGALFGYDLGVTGRPAHKHYNACCMSANHWTSEFQCMIMPVASDSSECKLVTGQVDLSISIMQVLQVL